MIQSRLICVVGLAEVVQHQLAVACAKSAEVTGTDKRLTQKGPNLAMVLLELGDGGQIVNGLGELISLFVYVCHAKHGGDGIRVVSKRLFVACQSPIEVELELGDGPCGRLLATTDESAEGQT